MPASSAVKALKTRCYPDDSKDGTLIFYRWLRQYTDRNSTALNIGAGGEPAARRCCVLKGEVRRVIGIDVEPGILTNPDLDQAFVTDPAHLPFRNGSFDLCWADHVLEHVRNPLRFLKEVARVLKPGASFFFRTPNKFHYVTLISRLIPHRLHQGVADWAHGSPPKTGKCFPTFYLINSSKTIRRSALLAGFRNAELKWVEPEPNYLLFHPLAFRIGVAYERLVNRHPPLSGFRAVILGRLEK